MTPSKIKATSSISTILQTLLSLNAMLSVEETATLADIGKVINESSSVTVELDEDEMLVTFAIISDSSEALSLLDAYSKREHFNIHVTDGVNVSLTMDRLEAFKPLHTPFKATADRMAEQEPAAAKAEEVKQPEPEVPGFWTGKKKTIAIGAGIAGAATLAYYGWKLFTGVSEPTV